MPLSASSSGMQQFLATAVLPTLAPNVQSLSLNAHGSEAILLQFFVELNKTGQMYSNLNVVVLLSLPIVTKQSLDLGT